MSVTNVHRRLSERSSRRSCAPRPARKRRWQQRSRSQILDYMDTMHPSYKSDIPGIAPDCRMQVEPVYEEPTTARQTPRGGMVSHRQIPRTAPAGTQSYMQSIPSASALG